ncbi:2-hydroxyacid dehydrogenase [Piscinibacter sakaiensis]|uniref:2-hydroxyacid dehydrogenase n=1 Tax=Piscinibacter sakaiensis TaxID=1547922 RepID=UPI003AAE4B26
MKPLLLCLIPLGKRRPIIEQACEEFGLELLIADSRPARTAAVAEHAARVRVVASNGTTGLDEAEIAAMPALGLIIAFGVGYERIAIDAARQRGIAVANGAGSNAACVADHALALLLGVIRGLRPLDSACRAGVWRDSLPLYPQLAGKRVGIVGFGNVGSRIAQRVAAFDAEVGYHSRTRRDTVPWPYFADAASLAEWSDHLVIATPGGAETHHLIDAKVLNGLGKRGCVVNVARGSVVDTAALAAALHEGRLAGAGLDVYESEPEPPRELFDVPNLLLTPHVGGNSPEAITAGIELLGANLRRHMRGEPLLTPVA